MRIAYCKTILDRTGVNSMWIINNSLDVLQTLEEKQLSLNKVSTWDFSTLYTSLPHAINSNFNCMIYWKEFLPPAEEKASLPPVTITPSGRMMRSLRNTLASLKLAENFALPLTFLSKNIYLRFKKSVFRQVIGIPMGTNSAPLLADLFLHTFEYDFMLKTMKEDMPKAVEFSNTFRYIDDLFSVWCLHISVGKIHVS